jgi:hypothetical protein
LQTSVARRVSAGRTTARGRAIYKYLVQPLLLGLLGLHLQTPTDRVERVRRVAGADGRELCTAATDISTWP